MKIGLIGINSQYVHSNLALYYLREELPSSWQGEIKEYNNNEPLLKIFYDIAEQEYDAVVFSVYLWNKETVIKLTELLHNAFRDLVIILGGPEPTYAPEDYSCADYIVAGALESVWCDLLTALEKGENADCICGVNDGVVRFSDTWHFPYREEDLIRLKNRLVYYETSRGCPYRCAFCLSSAEDSVAFLPMDRVKRELSFFLEHRIPVVKLVDRTFNSPRERGKEILRYLLDHYKEGTTFHFELKGELLDDETVELLLSAPKDYFQVEIGVQSLNIDTLSESCRKNQWEKTKTYYEKLIRAENVHTHFDLIAGLPHEGLDSFAFGFNEVMTIEPHYLQLGFLKLLPGTKLSNEREKYGYCAESFPPYEVVKSDSISVSQLGQLKKLDGFMDAVYNKAVLKQTLHFAMKKNGFDTFSLFMNLSKTSDFVNELQRLLPIIEDGWLSLVRLDGFLCGNGGSVTAEEERIVNSFVQDRCFIEKYLPHYLKESPREIYKRIRILLFPVKIVFDERGYVENILEGKTKILLDLHEKGKQKRGKIRPDFYVID